IAMILESRARGQTLLVCGGAGGKTQPLALRSGDLSQATHDALLARLRNTLRRQHGYPRAADTAGKVRKRVPRMGVRVLWFDQAAILPDAWTKPASEQTAAPQGLSCAGYGSVVMVTASMGLAAADEAVQVLLTGRHREPPPDRRQTCLAGPGRRGQVECRQAVVTRRRSCREIHHHDILPAAQAVGDPATGGLQKGIAVDGGLADLAAFEQGGALGARQHPGRQGRRDPASIRRLHVEIAPAALAHPAVFVPVKNIED